MKILRRGFNILLSMVGIIVFAIPMLVISIILKFREKHPIIFKQERIGLNKKPFNIYKFQTMVDGQVTPAGKILRKTGLDEIAQFFNVLKGDMNLVGPRALTEYDIKRLKWDDEYHNIRWSVKPGISGFAQIYGGQHRKLSWFWDMKYISNNSSLKDIYVLTVSFAMNFFGKTKVRRVIFRNRNLK